MSDSDGGVGGVGSSGSSAGVGGVGGAASTGSEAEAAADSMVDAARGITGVDTEAIGAQVASLQAADPAFGAAVQAAVEAQLSVVDAGRLQGAIDAAAAAQPSLAERLTTVSLAQVAEPLAVNPTYSYNVQGQLVDACGTRVTSVGAPDARQAALEKSLADYDEHAQKVTGGPMSGPMYSGAYVAGASRQTLDQVHAVGQMLDGFTEPLAQKAETMHVPTDR